MITNIRISHLLLAIFFFLAFGLQVEAAAPLSPAANLAASAAALADRYTGLYPQSADSLPAFLAGAGIDKGTALYSLVTTLVDSAVTASVPAGAVAISPVPAGNGQIVPVPATASVSGSVAPASPPSAVNSGSSGTISVNALVEEFVLGNKKSYPGPNAKDDLKKDADAFLDTKGLTAKNALYVQTEKKIVDSLAFLSNVQQSDKPPLGSQSISINDYNVEKYGPSATLSISTTTGSNPAGISGGLSINGNLNIANASMYAGTIPLGALSMGIDLSSSIATSKPSNETSSKYPDAEMLLPQGGIVNLYFSLNGAQSKVSYASGMTASDQLSPGEKPFGIRGSSGDKYYLFGLDPYAFQNSSDASPTYIVDTNGYFIHMVSLPNGLFYISNGLGPKVIYRGDTVPPVGSAGSTTSSYGLAGSAYLGFGIDGGGASLPSADGTVLENLSYNVEGIVTADLADHGSIAQLYPTAKNTRDYSFGFGLMASLVITNTMNLNVQYIVPFGPSSHYMDKVLLLGFSISK